VKYKL